jgi:hypothetical protein
MLLGDVDRCKAEVPVCAQVRLSHLSQEDAPSTVAGYRLLSQSLFAAVLCR